MKKRIIKAFTLVELLVVIAILAVLSTVTIVGYSSFTIKAYVSNDETKAELINRHLQIYSMDNPIESIEDVKYVIDDMYGEGSFEKLEPQSAKYGYHYWYNTATGNISLSKVNELSTSTNQNLLRKEAKKFNIDDSFRANVVPDYVLLDHSGSDLAYVVTKVDSLSSAEEYLSIINKTNKLVSDKYDSIVSQALANKLETSVIISNDGSYRYSEVNDVNNVYFTSNCNQITSVLYEYDGSNVNVNYLSSENNLKLAAVDTLTLPDSIVNVESYSLYLNENSSIYVSFTEEEILNVFKAYATNSLIVIGDASYVINGNEVKNNDSNETLGGLEYSNPVQKGDFTIKCEENENGKVKLLNDYLYVAYDQETFNLYAEFTNDQVSSKEVYWSSSNSNLVSIDDNGLAHIESLPEIGDEYEVTLKATAVAGEVSEEIKVFIVRPISGNITLDGSNVLLINNNSNYDNTIEINYTGEQTQFDFSEFYVTYNQSNLVSCEIDYEITTSGNLFEITGNSSEGYSLSLLNFEGSQELTIKVGEYLEKTFQVTVIDNSESPFKLVFENTDSYMYRVGNANAVKLSSLFTLDENKNIDSRDVTLNIYDASKTTGDNTLINIATSGDGFKATYTSSLTGTNWNSSTITFSGSGVVIVEIGVGTQTSKLALEVVDGKNVYSASDWTSSTNLVLLNDISYTGTGQLAISGKSLYGNGFAINATTYVSTTNSMISLSNGLIDNVIINGPVYPEVVYGSNNTYYAAGIQSYGSSQILNSYISGYKSPIKIQSGDLVLDNTTLDGGVYANLEVYYSTSVTLRNVTTIQTTRNVTVGSDLTKTVLGAGIIFSDANATKDAKLIIEGKLNQYNWVTKDDSSNLPSTYATIFTSIFSDSSYASFIHTVNGTQYINTGIVFSGERTTIGTDNRDDKSSVPYSSTVATKLGITGTVYTYDNSQGSVDATKMSATEYVSKTQSILKPAMSFTNVGIVPEDGDETYYYYDGTIHIGIPLNSSYAFNALEGVSFEKYSSSYVYDVTCENLDVINGIITFNKKGNYTIEYSLTDNLYYDIYGNIYNNSNTYKYYLDVEVSITTMPNAVLTFDDSNNVIYGKTGYPWDYDYYFCIPVLDGLTIVDYDENGAQNITIPETSAETSSDNALPENLSVSVSSSGHGFKNGGSLYVRTIATKVGGTWYSPVYSYSYILYLCGESATNNQETGSVTVTYSYTGGNGKTVSFERTFTFDTGKSCVDWGDFSAVN